MDSIPFHIVALLGSVVGFIGLLVAVQFSAHRKARRTWLEFAEDHDLDFEADDLQMTGTFRGGRVSARTHKSFLSSGVFQASTRIEAKLPDSVPSELVMSDEGLLFWKIVKRFVYIDMIVGRDELDRRYLIKPEGINRVRDFLDHDEVASAFVELHQFHRGVRIERQQLTVELASFVVPLRTRHELESYFQHIADFVERLETSESGRSASTHE